MDNKRKVEIFSTGCSNCQETIDLVHQIACPSCEISVLDMNDPNVAQYAKTLNVKSAPAVAVNGKLTSCCCGHKPNEAELRKAGIGQPL